MIDETQVDAIFLRIIELPDSEQEAALEAACPDPETRKRVQELLGWDSRVPHDFLAGDDRAEPTHLAGGSIGPYRILERLGEGGMGTVYAARQTFPQRDVALKVLRAGRISADAVRRFRHEIDILGRLQHNGIAQIYEAGVTEEPAGFNDPAEVPYFTMELVRGVPLVMHARSTGLGLPERIELLARVCDAVHYAHQRGVIHRDLKPENVLVALEESTTVHEGSNPMKAVIGQPKVLDFGIARVIDPGLEADRTRTVEGALIGTLSSMSPEQVMGDGALVDVRTDVYALGVMLYELICDRPPIALNGLAVPQAVDRILQGEIQAPGVHDTKLRGDLSTIALKALNKDVERRYQTAFDLAHDLRCFLAGEPIEARADSRMYLVRRSLQRHRVGLAIALAFAVMLAIFSGISLQQASASQVLAASESRARKMADDDFERALASLDLLTDLGTRRLEGTPRAEGIRLELVQAALEFHRGLLEAHPDEPSLGRRQADAHYRIAELERNLGNHEVALASARRAVEQYDALRDRPGGEGTAIDDGLGRSLTLLGHLLYRGGEAVESEQLLLRSIELAKAQLESAREPNSGDYARLGSANRHYALCLQRFDKFEQAQDVLVDCLPVIEAGLAEFDTVQLRTELAALLQNLVVVEMTLGVDERVERDTRRVIELVESLRVLEPNSPRHQQDLIGLHNNYSAFLGDRGRGAEARKSSDEAIAIGEALVAEHPDLVRPRENLFDAYNNRANRHMAESQLDAAQTDMTRAGELLNAMIAAAPNSNLLMKRALHVHNEGTLFMRREEYPTAIQMLGSSLKHIDELLLEEPTNRFMQTLRRYALINLASSWAQMGDDVQAEELLLGIHYQGHGASSTAEVLATLQAWQTTILALEQSEDRATPEYEEFLDRYVSGILDYLAEAAAAGLGHQPLLLQGTELARLLEIPDIRAALEVP